ncbi:MAG: hypothetical protein AAFZ15_31745 [Bacteroidota bacterium]
MKNSALLLLIALVMLVSCQKDEREEVTIVPPINFEDCDYKTDVSAPEGFTVNSIAKIDFDGTIRSFQFVNDQVGYALGSRNFGGFVAVFKTTDGGNTWTDLDVDIDQYPRNMVFKDENFGIISVHDVTGCPPPNCLNKCVILKTENGGQDWEEVELEGLNGILYHPQYDKEGNLYANLNLNDEYVIMKSTDDGASWSIFYNYQEFRFSSTTYSFKIFEDKLYVSGRDNKIYVINTNQELVKTIDIIGSPVWDVEIIDENNMVATVSGVAMQSTDGGTSWTTTYNQSARIIGFDSVDKGLMLLTKDYCPSDVFMANDVIAATNDGGTSWNEAPETTTNLGINFANSQKMGAGVWYFIADNTLIEVVEN